MEKKTKKNIIPISEAQKEKKELISDEAFWDIFQEDDEDLDDFDVDAEGDLPIEDFVKLIEDGYFHEEIPFLFLADAYPNLMMAWYPGFPNEPREMTEQDPVRLIGYVTKGIISFKGFPEEEPLELPEAYKDVPDGFYTAWIVPIEDSWSLYLQPDQ